MRTVSTPSGTIGCAAGLDELRLPQERSPLVSICGGIEQGMKTLYEPTCIAVEVPKRPQAHPSLLNAFVSDCPEFSIHFVDGDSAAFRSLFHTELRQYGASIPLRELLVDHISGMFQAFRDASPGSSREAFLILRRPRSRAHWHIDHYRPGAVQFVATLAGYPTTPFLLPGDYDRQEFERYRSQISRRELECHGLSPEDTALHHLKVGMNQLAQGVAPRFVGGDLLFKGSELFHATPKSPVSRLIFAMSAALR